MIITQANSDFAGQLPENRISVSIESTPELFRMLSDSIYSNKILAVIRELSCNAYDAHIAANNPEPFKVNLPTRLDPTFSVIDYGTGIHPDKIGDVFWTYGKSTKTNTNLQIGALGLGAKSPFAYTRSSYTVKNRWDGMEYTYCCFIDSTGIPNATMLNSESTQERNGITVEMAVADKDIRYFHDNASVFFSWWNKSKLPKFNMELDIDSFVEENKPKGKNWAFSANGGNYVVMGNIAYTVNTDYIPGISDQLRKMLENDVILRAEIGEVDFQPSREQLAFSDKTNKWLEEQCIIFWNDMRAYFKNDAADIKNHKPVIAYQKAELFKSKLYSILSTSVKDASFVLDNEDLNYTYNGKPHNIWNMQRFKQDIEIPGYSVFVFKSFKWNSASFDTISELEIKSKYNVYRYQKPNFAYPDGIPLNANTPLYRSMDITTNNGVINVKHSVTNTVVSFGPIQDYIKREQDINYNPIIFYVNDLIKETDVPGRLRKYIATKYATYNRHDSKTQHILFTLCDKVYVKNHPDYGVAMLDSLLKNTIYDGCKVILLSDIIGQTVVPTVKAPRNKKHNLLIPVMEFKIHKDNVYEVVGAQEIKKRVQVDEHVGFYFPIYKSEPTPGYHTIQQAIDILEYAMEFDLIPEFQFNTTIELVLLNPTMVDDVIGKRKSPMVNLLDQIIQRTKAIISDEFIVYRSFIRNKRSSFENGLAAIADYMIRNPEVDSSLVPFKYANPNIILDKTYGMKSNFIGLLGAKYFMELLSVRQAEDEMYNALTSNPLLQNAIAAFEVLQKHDAIRNMDYTLNVLLTQNK